jgi:hypothetical protein
MSFRNFADPCTRAAVVIVLRHDVDDDHTSRAE